MPSLSLKIGAVEVAYDGDQQFIEKGLSAFVAELIEAATKISPTATTAGAATIAPSPPTLGHTTSLIAQITSVKTGPDLALAGIAHLTLAQGKETVTRAEILAEMKGAASFYQENYSSNLTSILGSLVKSKKLNPVSKEVYALPAAQRKEFEEKLKAS